MPKIIMLAGAPVCKPWKEKDLIVTAFSPAFKHFLDLCESGERPEISASPHEPTTQPPAWRSIPVEDTHLPTGWSQPGWLDANAAVTSLSELRGGTSDHSEECDVSFLTTTSVYDDDNETDSHLSPAGSAEQLSQFLEHSFALHEETSTSVVTPAAKTPLLLPRTLNLHDEDDTASDSVATGESPSQHIANNTSTAASLPKPAPETPLRPPSARLVLPYLADLSTLPTAASLIRLEPQTITVDLLVGIISVSPARTVTIRRTGRETQLVEVLVGDETRAGFSVTFWLPDANANANVHVARSADADMGLRKAVEALRPGNLVGVRNVALSHFRGRVHGQSLGGRRGRGGGTMVVKLDADAAATLARERGSGLVAKFERVKGWTRDFVRPAGVQMVETKKRKRPLARLDDLPPDETQ